MTLLVTTLLLVFIKVNGDEVCYLKNIKVISDGCDSLTGLNVTSVGGNVVSDRNCDVVLPKKEFLEEPLFRYRGAKLRMLYTIMMVDPDALPQIEGEYYLHLLKCNIPGFALKIDNGNEFGGGNYIVDYRSPTPPHGTGLHRYIGLLFMQTDGNITEVATPPARNRFHLANWMKGQKLCGPIAGTQFRAQF